MSRVIGRRRYDLAGDPSIGRARRNVASWLGLILLLVNVAGAGAMPSRSAEAGPAPFTQDLFGDRIVICTAAGMVVLDRDGNVVETRGDAQSAHTDFCVFCLPLMHGGVQAPAMVAQMVAPTIVADVAAPAPQSPRPTAVRLSGAHSPRAPPLS